MSSTASRSEGSAPASLTKGLVRRPETLYGPGSGRSPGAHGELHPCSKPLLCSCDPGFTPKPHPKFELLGTSAMKLPGLSCSLLLSCCTGLWCTCPQ